MNELGNDRGPVTDRVNSSVNNEIANSAKIGSNEVRPAAINPGKDLDGDENKGEGISVHKPDNPGDTGNPSDGNNKGKNHEGSETIIKPIEDNPGKLTGKINPNGNLDDDPIKPQAVAGGSEVPNSGDKGEIGYKGPESDLESSSLKLNEDAKQQYERLLADLSKKHGSDTEKYNEMKEIIDYTVKLTSTNYERAGRIADKAEGLHSFIDHREAHVLQVADKSMEASDAVKDAIANNDNLKEHYSTEINDKELLVSVLFHDTGMDGNMKPEDYEKNRKEFVENPENLRNYLEKKEKDCKEKGLPYSKDEFIDKYNNGDNLLEFDNSIREQHSLASAIHALENREQIKKIDGTVNPDLVAINCMIHSKNCSGVKDLTNKDQWSNCIDKIDQAVREYNEEHQDNKISFDKSVLVNPDENGEIVREWGKPYNFNEEQLKISASCAAVIRIGDANRDSDGPQITQTGKTLNVDSELADMKAKTAEAEVAGVKITACDANGSIEEINNEKSKIFTCGEGNIEHMNVSCVNGTLTETFEIKNGLDFPNSTQFCLEERIKEFDTMGKVNVNYNFVFNDKSYTEEERKQIEDSYRTWGVAINSRLEKREREINLIFQ